MGYNSHVWGGLVAKPAVPEKAIADDFGETDSDRCLIATNGGEDDDLQLVDGELTIIPGNTFTLVECRYDDEFKAYSLSDDVGAFVSIATDHGSVVNGSMYARGEDGELHRVRVENNKVLEEWPELVWPNGDRGTPS